MKHISILAIILSLLIPPTIQARTLEYNHTVSNNVFTENTFTKEKPEQLIAYSKNLPIDSFTKTANATQNSAIAIDNFNESFTKPVSNSNESKANFISRTTLYYFAATELPLWNEREIVAAGKVGIDVAKATEKQLDDIYLALKSNPPFKYTANTIEHKADRWAQYKARMGADALDYSTWSNVYNSNMTNAIKANKAADEVMSSFGWGKREVTVPANGYNRRLDIADASTRRGVEVKSYETGKVYSSEGIRTEIVADKYLVENDWDIEWVFKNCEPSGPLEQMLKDAGIRITRIP